MSDTAQTHAILIMGGEPAFAQETAMLEGVLRLAGTTITLLENRTSEDCLEAIAAVLARADMERDAVLISFSGHGSRVGWQTSTSANTLTFDALFELLGSYLHHIQICASTCFSHHLIKAAIGRRSMFNTSVLVNYAFGDNVYEGGALADIARAWSKQHFARDADVPYHGQETNRAYSYGLRLQHWGILIDHYFFPRDAKSPS